MKLIENKTFYKKMVSTNRDIEYSNCFFRECRFVNPISEVRCLFNDCCFYNCAMVGGDVGVILELRSINCTFLKGLYDV